jgi:hypothetical protein
MELETLGLSFTHLVLITPINSLRDLNTRHDVDGCVIATISVVTIVVVKLVAVAALIVESASMSKSSISTPSPPASQGDFEGSERVGFHNISAIHCSRLTQFELLDHNYFPIESLAVLRCDLATSIISFGAVCLDCDESSTRHPDTQTTSLKSSSFPPHLSFSITYVPSAV